MKEKYIKFYEWYHDSRRRILKYGVASFILLFSIFLYFYLYTSLLIPATPAITIGHSEYNAHWITVIIGNINEMSYQLLNWLNPFVVAPYLIIVFLFIILILYKNIFLKIAMVLTCIFPLLFQFIILMGFTSYLDFVVFLPQIVLIVVGFYMLYRTNKWRMG